MEEHFIDAATADLLVKVGWYLASAFLALVVGVISTLLWGRGGRKRLVERLAALEAQAQQPSINQTINFKVSPDGDEHDRQLRAAIDAETSQNLEKTIRRLPQIPLGEGHTYARLPDGTNIVSLADGTFRLALPILISASFEGAVAGKMTVRVEKRKAEDTEDDDDQRKAGTRPRAGLEGRDP